MLNKLNFLSIAVFPYYVLLIFFILLGGYGGEHGLILLASIGIFYLVAFISAILLFTSSLKKSADTHALLRTNLILKLIHMPAYVMLFIMGLLSTITIFTIGFTLVVILLDVLIIILSGLVGLGAISKALMDKQISKEDGFLHGAMQFVFCIDIFSAIVVYRKLKNGVPLNG